MKRMFLFLLSLFISGCVGASTFGMNQESYERNLLSLKDKTIDYEVQSIFWAGGPKEIGKKLKKGREHHETACSKTSYTPCPITIFRIL